MHSARQVIGPKKTVLDSLVRVSRRGFARTSPAAYSLTGSGLATYTLFAGVVGLAAILAIVTLVFSGAGPLHDVAGLVQRLLLLAILFPCRTILAARPPTLAIEAPRSAGHHRQLPLTPDRLHVGRI